ncbi:EAL domain-containing protein [Halomonas sabkhae]|uniref:putative bifunctional diguanylate cyclase/phosphodiesterase n=1 Tax=Halomonas sabkhae TaxID=626223 RepID=UPI0025B57183|nr:EAL domain-containing protein [Halomonas sabkhae]MDN3524566.1 EAL domain-containing protein [Halomonas sabkhae]
MRASRFSQWLWGLGIVLLTLASVTPLVMAYLGSEKLLHESQQHTLQRDQRLLEEVLGERFMDIRSQSRAIAGSPDLHKALGDADFDRIRSVLQQQLANGGRRHIDALALGYREERVVASRQISPDRVQAVLNDNVTVNEWQSVTEASEADAGEWLVLPVQLDHQVTATGPAWLYALVRLNDNDWLASVLMSTFGASAVSLQRNDTVLVSRETGTGQLAALAGMRDARGLVEQDSGILRHHTWQVGNSAQYQVRSWLPNTASPLLRDIHLTMLLVVCLMVVVLVGIWLLAVRHLTGRLLADPLSDAQAALRPETRPGRSSVSGDPASTGQRLERTSDAGLWQAHEQDSFFSGIIRYSPECIFVKDVEGYHRLVNKQYARTLWSSPEALVGKRDEMVLPEHMLDQARSSDREVLDSGKSVKYEATVRTPEGVRTFLVTKFPISDGGDTPHLLGGIATDITELKETQERLGLVQNVFAETTEAIIVLDDRHNALIANRAFSELSGYEQSQATPAIQSFLLEHPEVASQLDKQRRWQGQCFFVHRQGGILPVLVSATTLPKTSGEARYVLRFNDITELKLAEHRLEHLAWYDQLTGLPNRSLFSQRLEEALEQASTMTAILFIDLDHFKDINDKYGHSRGDQVLCQVADRLRTCVQAKDVISRFGADEFTVMLRDIDTEAQVMSIASRVMNTLEMPFEAGEDECLNSVSIGITLSMRHGGTAETLLRNADQAMYVAKERGRQRIVLFDPSIDARQQQRLNYEMGLREALNKNELFVRYQPRFEISGRRIVGAEALVRWESQEHGLVPPDIFIPIAEGTRLIVDIGRFVMEQACHEAARWAEQGEAVPVSVNLSPKQLREDGLWSDIQRILRESGLAPNMLELELTESMLVDNIDLVLPLLQRIRALGVNIAIDDFGTGYSSLAYLKQLPVDTVKVDRSFINDVPGSPEDETLLQAIVSMARSLNYRVVAEGVESEQQRAFLETLGCDELQGFLLGRPESGNMLISQVIRAREGTLEGDRGATGSGAHGAED